MIVLTTVPAVPGMLVARSNVLCTANLPVASSGRWLPPPPLPPLPSPLPSPPGMSGEEVPPQAAVVPSARARARARLFVVFMVILRRGLLSTGCAAHVPPDRRWKPERPRTVGARMADRLARDSRFLGASWPDQWLH